MIGLLNLGRSRSHEGGETPVCVFHLLEARWHAPAAGLHDAVVTAHVLSHLPVLLTPLLSARHQRRVTEERRNTVTGQSGSNGVRGRKRGERRRSVSSLASQQRESEKKKRWRKEAEAKLLFPVREH